MKSRKLFGTDGIRGQAGIYPLDSAGAFKVGKAVGAHFTQVGESVLVGYDPRQSSYSLATAVAAGLTSMGTDVDMMGVIPTPGLACLTRQSPAQAGVMITASHNPYTDNGIKVFGAKGDKLPDSTEAALNGLIEDEVPDRGFGQRVELAAAADYEDFLVAAAGEATFAGLNIALDTANGATSGLAQRVFERLGATVTPLFDQPDGRNINDHCGATHTEPLAAIVRQHHGRMIGAAFDGDGDRLLLVDERGRALTGDHILYILAMTSRPAGVVATIMSNMGLETALTQAGIALHRTAVGDRYVLEALEQTGFTLGGEQSGHIILPQLTTTGDGLLAAITTLQQVRASGRSLADWYDALPLVPQALVNIPLADKALLADVEVTNFIAQERAALGRTGRLNIRPSGTEPIARIMVEAPQADRLAHDIAARLQTLITAPRKP